MTKRRDSLSPSRTHLEHTALLSGDTSTVQQYLQQAMGVKPEDSNPRADYQNRTAANSAETISASNRSGWRKQDSGTTRTADRFTFQKKVVDSLPRDFYEAITALEDAQLEEFKTTHPDANYSFDYTIAHIHQEQMIHAYRNFEMGKKLREKLLGKGHSEKLLAKLGLSEKALLEEFKDAMYTSHKDYCINVNFVKGNLEDPHAFTSRTINFSALKQSTSEEALLECWQQEFSATTKQLAEVEPLRFTPVKLPDQAALHSIWNRKEKRDRQEHKKGLRLHFALRYGDAFFEPEKRTKFEQVVTVKKGTWIDDNDGKKYDPALHKDNYKIMSEAGMADAKISLEILNSKIKQALGKESSEIYKAIGIIASQKDALPEDWTAQADIAEIIGIIHTFIETNWAPLQEHPDVLTYAYDVAEQIESSIRPITRPRDDAEQHERDLSKLLGNFKVTQNLIDHARQKFNLDSTALEKIGLTIGQTTQYPIEEKDGTDSVDDKKTKEQKRQIIASWLLHTEDGQRILEEKKGELATLDPKKWQQNQSYLNFCYYREAGLSELQISGWKGYSSDLNVKIFEQLAGIERSKIRVIRLLEDPRFWFDHITQGTDEELDEIFGPVINDPIIRKQIDKDGFHILLPFSDNWKLGRKGEMWFHPVGVANLEQYFAKKSIQFGPKNTNVGQGIETARSGYPINIGPHHSITDQNGKHYMPLGNGVLLAQRQAEVINDRAQRKLLAQKKLLDPTYKTPKEQAAEKFKDTYGVHPQTLIREILRNMWQANLCLREGLLESTYQKYIDNYTPADTETVPMKVMRAERGTDAHTAPVSTLDDLKIPKAKTKTGFGKWRAITADGADRFHQSNKVFGDPEAITVACQKYGITANTTDVVRALCDYDHRMQYMIDLVVPCADIERSEDPWSMVPEKDRLEEEEAQEHATIVSQVIQHHLNPEKFEKPLESELQKLDGRSFIAYTDQCHTAMKAYSTPLKDTAPDVLTDLTNRKEITYRSTERLEKFVRKRAENPNEQTTLGQLVGKTKPASLPGVIEDYGSTLAAQDPQRKPAMSAFVGPLGSYGAELQGKATKKVSVIEGSPWARRMIEQRQQQSETVEVGS